MKMAVGAAVFADSESVAAMVLHTGEAARSVSAETPGRELRHVVTLLHKSTPRRSSATTSGATPPAAIAW